MYTGSHAADENELDPTACEATEKLFEPSQRRHLVLQPSFAVQPLPIS